MIVGRGVRPESVVATVGTSRDRRQRSRLGGDLRIGGQESTQPLRVASFPFSSNGIVLDKLVDIPDEERLRIAGLVGDEVGPTAGGDSGEAIVQRRFRTCRPLVLTVQQRGEGEETR